VEESKQGQVANDGRVGKVQSQKGRRTNMSSQAFITEM